MSKDGSTTMTLWQKETQSSWVKCQYVAAQWTMKKLLQVPHQDHAFYRKTFHSFEGNSLASYSVLSMSGGGWVQLYLMYVCIVNDYIIWYERDTISTNNTDIQIII